MTTSIAPLTRSELEIAKDLLLRRSKYYQLYVVPGSVIGGALKTPEEGIDLVIESSGRGSDKYEVLPLTDRAMYAAALDLAIEWWTSKPGIEILESDSGDGTIKLRTTYGPHASAVEVKHVRLVRFFDTVADKRPS